ncbi:unnamed protein product [Rotaria sp. Silwood2]|nr:unnamed protein product [Rotaria sp. Silwood2]CAF3006995.1 unnamed protein product [Rotaria sp. Silwood2]CAF3280872.1 unnamed protein product [Rotaria sp. Silwood2]CAF3351830.1 unnamed protein product [Rotaria sp. Silwood2]CAF4118750.1 unnamed protein product [Rotaria sp. Silwood2]
MEATSGDNETINLTIITFQSTLPHRGALALTILLILNLYFAGMSSITVTSRIGFAMARDGIFPFSNYLRWIFEPTKTPLANVVFVCIIDSLLLLLQLVSTTAFVAIIAITTLGFQISYFMPIFFRCTIARDTFQLGGFNLGRFSIPIAIISSIWLFITSIFMCFPTEYPVTKDNMNYTIVIISGIALIAVIYWLVSARHRFVGPKRIDMDPTSLPVELSTNGNEKTTAAPETPASMVTRL